MGAHRSLKSGGNWPLNKGKMGFIGKKGGASPGRALFTVQRSRALGKEIPLLSPLIVRIP